ncbi:DTW domain-containing protein [Marinomonas algicola]|uniref:DTW domain-containing protein n=1 Tax=Marinomonas algicola TaxID=2773454 RepID=UPI0017484CB8|nr:tRNA-uridine aminocarboxypropyltransferase [Marinomonas algicola]
MPRAVCAQCFFLKQNCVCHFIPNVHTDLKVIVFQSLQEAKHPKNTVRLLRLAMPSIQVIPVVSQEDILRELNLLDLTKWCLIYPCDQSTPIEIETKQSLDNYEGILLIDATWRKAFSMYHTCQQFEKMATKHFLSPPKGNYFIRKTSKENALSTFEACVYTLECIEKLDLSALKVFFSQVQQWQWRRNPYISQITR